MEKTKEIMSQQKHTITDISHMVGYDSYTTFKRVFVKHYGVTPSEFMQLIP